MSSSRPSIHALACAAALASTLGAVACGGSNEGGAASPSGGGPAGAAKVTTFAVDPANLNVDSIGVSDGAIRPDGNRDLVFTATVVGPADALYLVTVDDRGEPIHGFRADTVAGHEEFPPELARAGQVDIGRLTVWMAVVERGSFINKDNGALGTLAAGPHELKLYVPNTGTLRPGSHLRLYARSVGGGLVAGPTVPY